jgi:hypothetical protein
MKRLPKSFTKTGDIYIFISPFFTKLYGSRFAFYETKSFVSANKYFLFPGFSLPKWVVVREMSYFSAFTKHSEFRDFHPTLSQHFES